MKNILVTICLLVLVILSSLSYEPLIFANSGQYDYFHSIILLTTVVLFLISNNIIEMFKNKFMNKILLPLTLFMVLIMLFYGMGLMVSMDDILQIGIVYISIWIGHELKLSPKVITALLFIYGIVAIYLGYTSVITYLATFSLDENLYAIDAKNQIGAIVAIATFFFLYIAQGTKNKALCILSYILFAVLLTILIYIRCRTALLALIFTALIVIFKVNSLTKLSIYFIIGLAAVILYSDSIIDTIHDAFIGDRTVTNMDELSSNRMERNEQGLLYISNNIFIGEMKGVSGIAWIHNYIINRLVKYGIWAFPLILIYVFVAIKSLKQIIQFKKFSFYDIGYFLMIIPFICSILEPDAPFGPGTVYSFSYIMFGYSLKNSLNKSI